MTGVAPRMAIQIGYYSGQLVNRRAEATRQHATSRNAAPTGDDLLGLFF
jgi:hypothetical protein